ncbi:hypothetical protein IL306_009575 [Fusarium sp. DS 682]|nr:hypothetical protein IL306_009575 [Fusarium sp. DS 682]
MAPSLGRSIRLLLSSLRGDGSIRIGLVPGKEAMLLLTQDDGHYEHDEDEDDPDETHVELQKYLDDVAGALKTTKNNAEIDVAFNERLSQMVYGSNMIEAVGSGLDITVQLCRDIFEGKDVEDVEINDPTYQALRMELMKKRKSSGHEDVLRSHREIVQHAKAAYYIMNEVAIKGNDISEDIILETHRLLTYKIDSPDGIPWREYGGSYRTHPADIEAAEESGEIDPVALAAKYSHKFVNIHPFLDGNSRTSRLILNTILLKYGGCFVCVGKDAKDSEEYMRISAEGFSLEAMAQQQEEMNDLPDEYKPKHHKKLATFILKHVMSSMYNFSLYHAPEVAEAAGSLA